MTMLPIGASKTFQKSHGDDSERGVDVGVKQWYAGMALCHFVMPVQLHVQTVVAPPESCLPNGLPFGFL